MEIESEKSHTPNFTKSKQCTDFIKNTSNKFANEIIEEYALTPENLQSQTFKEKK